MDKELNKIIDVTKCKYYGYKFEGMHKCYCDPELMCGEVMGYDNCEDKPDCYYKQLKRKEQKLDKIIEFVNDNMQGSNYSYSLELLRIMGVNIDG